MDPQNVTPTPVNSPKSSKKLIVIVVVIIILAGIGWFFSRGNKILPVPGYTVDKNMNGSATYTNNQGSVTVNGNSYPDNWPSDAPKYSGAKIRYSASSNPQTGQAGSAVVFTTTDNSQKVIDFYKKELSANGWSLEQTASIGQMTVLSAKKGSSIFSAQIAATESGQTTVTVAIGN